MDKVIQQGLSDGSVQEDLNCEAAVDADLEEGHEEEAVCKVR